MLEAARKVECSYAVPDHEPLTLLGGLGLAVSTQEAGGAIRELHGGSRCSLAASGLLL